MSQQPSYKTLKGGAIDCSHYIARGRSIRSREANASTHQIWNSIKIAAQRTLHKFLELRQNARRQPISE